MNARNAVKAFEAFVGGERFPCLAAKGVVRQRGYRLGIYDSLASLSATAALARDLAEFSAAIPTDGSGLVSFVAVFSGRPPSSELAFEKRLWRQLQQLSDRDTQPWDSSVSDNPEDPDFGFSFGGCGYFVVGMHPESGRVARRFSRAALVFNPHAQFTRLRAAGRFERLRTVIRERDAIVQGAPTTVLADHGERSEARQYAARETSGEFRCPFHHRDG